MSNKIKTILAILIFCVVFIDKSYLISIINSISKEKIPVVSIEPPPEKALIELTLPVAKLITDKEDRATLAVFNKEFADRLPKYVDINTQQLQDIYVASGAEIFGKALSTKYEKLGSSITSLFSGVIGQDEHSLSKDEANSLSNIFKALSWNLTQ